MNAYRSSMLLAVSLCVMVWAGPSQAYQRYRDPITGNGNCSACHGVFTGSTSPKGTVFPSNSKHEMHRGAANMNTDCALCHLSTDNRNPYTKLSDGVGSVSGVGCTGCHNPLGLRAHHAANGITLCAGCHDDTGLTPPAENVAPPYYGTAYTRARNPANPVAAAKTNENWSIGDFLGLDNDGDNLYDMTDPDNAPATGLWAGAVDAGGGWKWVAWFGYLKDGGGAWNGWIFHAEHGWLYCSGTSPSSIWFWSSRMNSWLWSSSTAYPFFWNGSAGAWWYYYLGTGTGSGGWFKNYANGLLEWH